MYVCERQYRFRMLIVEIILTTEIIRDNPHVPMPSCMCTHIFPWCFKIRGKQIVNEPEIQQSFSPYISRQIIVSQNPRVCVLVCLLVSPIRVL